MDRFSSLPEEIALEILTRVPTESVLQCKLVCRTWRGVVGHPSFSNRHLHRLNHPSTAAADSDSGTLGFIALTGNENFYYVEYNENHEPTPIQRIKEFVFTPELKYFSFVGSCNGLICLARGKEFVCICNFITREYVMLPEIKIHCAHYYSSTGFGYVSSTNEYKVVSMINAFQASETNSFEVYIYTLGSGLGWRNLGKFDFETCTYVSKCILADESLYLMGVDLEVILTFDLVEEKFCERLSPPPFPLDGEWYMDRIGVLDGALFYANKLVEEGAACYDVWLSKELEEHQLLGWSKEFRIYERKFFAVTKSGGVLTYTGSYLNIYDTKASTSERLVDFKERIRRVLPHKNTLISLKELGEVDTMTMESVEVEDTESDDQPLKQPYLSF